MFNILQFFLYLGDIEDFPGLDSIPSFKVTVANGNVKVSAKKCKLENPKFVKPLTKRNPENKHTFIVIGSGKIILCDLNEVVIIA